MYDRSEKAMVAREEAYEKACEEAEVECNKALDHVSKHVLETPNSRNRSHLSKLGVSPNTMGIHPDWGIDFRFQCPRCMGSRSPYQHAPRSFSLSMGQVAELIKILNDELALLSRLHTERILWLQRQD